jgi:hypothetical protein
MIIDDLDLGWARLGPAQADPKLVVDPDGMLPGSIVRQ